MQAELGSPSVYWVVGDRTNAGKTTIASALIKALNANGERTVGFKPFGGSQLTEIIDFMFERYPASRSKVFGEDGWKLTAASPLTGPEVIDLVSPTHLIAYPYWDSNILMRTGSESLSNVEYFCSTYGAKLKDRSDLREIIGKTGLPFDDATVLDSIGFQFAAKVSSEKYRLAFDRLLEVGVDAIVCEGAMNLLPIWQDCPPVNHVFFLAAGVVNYFPNVDLSFSFRMDDPIRRVKELMEALADRRSPKFSLPLYLVGKGRRDEIAQIVTQRLLTKAQEGQ